MLFRPCKRVRTFPREMDLRVTALLLPATLTAALVAVRGRDVVAGQGSRSFLVLAATALATLVTALLLARREARRRPTALPREVEAVLGGAATPLGDPALAFDAAGRLVWANPPAVALSGYGPAALLGRRSDAFGGDLAVLLRGVERGPALGRVVVPVPDGAVEALAAAVRIPGRSPVDVVVLRTAPGGDVREVTDADLVDDAATPPPLPSRRAAEATRGAAEPIAGDAALVAAGLEEPLARAGAAAALLRLTLPPGQLAAAAQLARLERALHEAEATLAALAEPVAPPAARAVDVDVALDEALAAAHLPPSVNVERRGGATSAALADPGHLRSALRHLLHAAGQAMPSGGRLVLTTARRAGEVAIELADTGAARAAAPGLDLSLARRLLAAQGGRLERAALAGRGTLVRVVLPAARPAARAAVL